MRKKITYPHGGERENFHFSPNLDTMSKLGHIHFDRYFGINTNDKPGNEIKKMNLQI